MDLREISALCSTRHPRLIQILLLECIDLIHYFFREYVDYEKIIPDFKQLRKFVPFPKWVCTSQVPLTSLLLTLYRKWRPWLGIVSFHLLSIKEETMTKSYHSAVNLLIVFSGLVLIERLSLFQPQFALSKRSSSHSAVFVCTLEDKGRNVSQKLFKMHKFRIP